MTNYPLCVVDQRPVHTDGHLCAACWADLEHDLAELPELVHDLERVLAGLTRTGGSPIGIVVRTAERGIGFDEKAGDLLRELHNTLGGWVRVIAEDNALPIDMPDETVVLATWLRYHRGDVVRHEAVGELWSEVHELAERARRSTDRRADRRYLGVCSASLDVELVRGATGDLPPMYRAVETCDSDLYVVDGYDTATCRACGTTYDVAHRRRILLDAVDDQLGTAAEISHALAAYADQELRVERVRKWYSRGQIAQYPPREGDRWPRYRVGDVRDILDPNRTVKAG